MTKKDETRGSAMKTKARRWCLGTVRLDPITNEEIRKVVGAAAMKAEMREKTFMLFWIHDEKNKCQVTRMAI